MFNTAPTRNGASQYISAAIYGKELFSLFLIIIRINRSHADIDHGIAHSGILPVDEPDPAIRQEKEVIADAVNVAEGLFAVQTVQTL